MTGESDRPIYPPEGTIGHLVLSSSPESLDERIVPLDGMPAPGSQGPREAGRVLEEAEKFLRLNRSISGSLPTGNSRFPFRKIPSERMFGRFRYFALDESVLVGAYVPPLMSCPTSVQFLMVEEVAESISERLADIGFPLPDQDATFIVGQPDSPEGQVIVFAPGPEGLAELVYRIQVGTEKVILMVSAERPPERRYSELIRDYEDFLPQDGTVLFEDREEMERGSGRRLASDNRIHKKSYE